MSKLAKIAAVLMVGMMVSGVVLGAEMGHKKDVGPSAKETVNFINGLFACEVVRQQSVPNPNIHITEYQRSNANVDEKVFLLTEVIDQSSYDNGRDGGYFNFDRQSMYHNNVRVSLSDLDVNVTTKNRDVVLNCDPSVGACMNITKVYGNGRSEPSQVTLWNLNFCNEDQAQRAAKAMKHLIEISGGKKSLF